MRHLRLSRGQWAATLLGYFLVGLVLGLALGVIVGR